MTEFGISPAELAGISSTWRNEASKIGDTDWSAFGRATGAGSDVLCAVRQCADPAEQATESIKCRIDTLAQKVDTFAGDAIAQDQAMGTAIDELSPR